jgi:putative endonuclease
MTYYVYILANKPRGTLYVGVTNNLVRRVFEHKSKLIKGFTERYDVNSLVWYESSESIESAIAYEKKLKRWRRDWKIEMLEKQNAEWVDLYSQII